MSRMLVVGLSSFALLLAGPSCSDIEIRKVPSPTQYSTWDDNRQACADSNEGFRFAMQRPFVVVNRPFPLSARSYVVDGLLSPLGHVVITPPADSPLKNTLLTCNQCAQVGGARSGQFTFSYGYVQPTRVLRRGADGRVEAEGDEAPPADAEPPAPADDTVEQGIPPTLIQPPRRARRASPTWACASPTRRTRPPCCAATSTS